MRPHHTSSIVRPDTHLSINDYLNDSHRLTHRSIGRENRFPTALVVLAFGLGLAMLGMLGTWLSLAPQATSRGTTIVAHPDEQTLSIDELEGRALILDLFDDILTRF